VRNYVSYVVKWEGPMRGTIFLCSNNRQLYFAFSALMLLVGRQEGHQACKKTEWWGTGMVICLERGANDLHMVQLMPLPRHHLLLQ